MKKTITFIVLTALILVLVTSCAPKVEKTVAKTEQERYVYLVVGLDDAAENTDVIFTLSYDSKNNTAYIAQIPRDTYYYFGKSQNKINQIFSSLISEGKSNKEALRITSEKIADLFGTKFDGYIGLTIDTTKAIIDAIGGIDLDLEKDMILCPDGESPIVLNKGRNHIDSDTAIRFIRFRSGYAMGDLGRIDAQKLFLNALFCKIKDGGISLPLIFKLANIFQNKIITNIKLVDLLPVYVDAMNSNVDKKVFYLTVPGLPCQNSKGLSFYVLNRKSVAEISKRYMNSTCAFDAGYLCKNPQEPQFESIYEDDSIGYYEYSNDNINNIRIINK